MTEHEELEFALREYTVATEHLIEVLEKVEKVPPSIFMAALGLANAINREWD